MKHKLNSFALLKWIAENGGQEAKVYLSRETGITINSINRALAKKCAPRIEYRYLIYITTGVRLLDADDFPEVEIKKRDAS